jgi:hypothetical protein
LGLALERAAVDACLWRQVDEHAALRVANRQRRLVHAESAVLLGCGAGGVDEPTQTVAETPALTLLGLRRLTWRGRGHLCLWNRCQRKDERQARQPRCPS